MNIDKLYDNEQLAQLVQKEQPVLKKTVQKIRAKKPRKLDVLMHELHDEAFDQIDCLSCANCCKGLGPRIVQKDIERLAKHLKIKPSKFIEQYLRIDEDKDYVFKTMPCPFLGADNYCFVYEHRPKACREYPHTNHTKMINKLNLALKNVDTCPAVFYVLSKLSMIHPNNIK